MKIARWWRSRDWQTAKSRKRQDVEGRRPRVGADTFFCFAHTGNQLLQTSAQRFVIIALKVRESARR